MQNRKRQTKDGVIGLTVGQKLIQQLRYMRQRHRPRVAHLVGQRGLEHFERIQPRQFLPLAIFVKRPYVRQRLQGTAKAPLGFLRSARHAAHFAFCPGEQGDQQIGFAQGIRAQHDSFRLLQWHGVTVKA